MTHVIHVVKITSHCVACPYNLSLKWKYQVKRRIDLEIRVIAQRMEAMIDKVIIDYSQISKRVTAVIGIGDLVVHNIEAITIGMTGIVVHVTGMTSHITVEAMALHTGSMVIGIITVVIQTTTEVEGTHLIDFKTGNATNAITIIVGRESWRQNRDQYRQQSGYDNSYYTQNDRNAATPAPGPRGQNNNNVPSLSDLRSFVTNDGVSFSVQQNNQNFQ